MAAAGDRYGRWTLIPKVTMPGAQRWRVKCDCGTTRSVILHKMVSGQSRSCGCTRAAMHSKVITAAMQPKGV